MRQATLGLDASLVRLKISAVSALAQTLRRYTSLNHLAQAARAVLKNSNQINQMLTDLNRVDFNNVQVCNHIDTTYSDLKKGTLHFYLRGQWFEYRLYRPHELRSTAGGGAPIEISVANTASIVFCTRFRITEIAAQ